MKRHLLALSALFFLHLVIFARLIFLTREGVPYATIPYDFASAYAPWLTYIGDCFRSGIIPLWSPYAGGGTPFFINPQSQIYSPLTIIIGLVFGYTHRIAQLQIVTMLFLGGVGAYLLSYSLWRSRWAGLVTAICFNFTSAIFSNLEHMAVINTVTLAPWLFWATTLTAKFEKLWAFPILSFLLYFILTSGYPGVILMVLFWVSAYTVYLIYLDPYPLRKKLGIGVRHGIAWLLGLCLSAVHWIPIVIHRKEFTRGKPLPIDQTLFGGNLFFKHIWGMVFQFMTATPLPGEDIDLSMRGLYFGALAIPLALAALLLIKDRITPAIMVFSSATFLMACGGLFFGRVALHIFFPFLNLSRFPSVDSRALMVLGLVVLAGGGVKLLEQKHPQGQSIIFRGCLYLMAALTLGLFGFRSLADAATYHNVIMNYITVEMFFVALALLALRIFSGRLLMISMVTLLALEMGTCVAANFRIIGAPVNADAYRTMVANHRRDFSPEAANVPRIAGGTTLVDEAAGRGYPEKIFFISEYNPLRLHRFDHLIAVGFTEWLTNGARVVALPPDSRPDNYESFAKQVRPVEYTISSYTPNQVVYKVRAEQDSLLVFNEIFFPGWRAYVDGVQTPVNEVSGGLRCVLVTGGEHIIVMSFRPRSFYRGLAVSLISVLLFLLWSTLIFYRLRRRPLESEKSAQPVADQNS